MALSAVRRFLSIDSMVQPSLVTGELPSSSSMYRQTMAVALPAMLEMVFASLIQTADTIMVSSLGYHAIASIGITAQPRMLVLSVFTALNVGVTSVVARMKGAEDPEAANCAMRQSLMMTGLLSVAVSLLAILFSKPLLLLAGANSEILADADSYFKITNIGLIFTVLSLSVSAAQRGIGNTKISLGINVSANLVNILFNWLLITGNLGFPRLEVDGAAIATAIGNVVGFVIAMVSLMRPGRFLYIRLRDNWRPDLQMLGRIFGVGGNAALEQLMLRIGFFFFARVVAGLGTQALATHQICLQINNFAFTLGDSLSVAATSLTGQNLGKNRPDLAMISTKVAQRVAVGLSCVVFFVLFFGGEVLVRAFSDEQEIIRMGALLLKIVAGFQIMQTSQCVFNGALRGAGDTRYVAFIMLVGVVFIRPATSVLMVWGFHWGLVGAWVSMAVDTLVRLILGWRRFHTGKWTMMKV